MERYDQLYDQKATLIAEEKATLEAAKKSGESLTEEQLTRLDVIEGELASADRQIAAFDRLHEHEADQAKRALAARDGEQQTIVSNLHDNREDAPFATMGDFLFAVGQAGMNNAFDPRLTQQAVASGLGESTPSDGGFAVQKDFSVELMRRARTSSVLHPLVRKVTIGPNSNGFKAPVLDETSQVTGSRGGGVQFFWSDEGTAATATQPKLRMLNLDLYACKALCYAGDELLADAVALDSWIGDEFAREAGEEIDDKIINGNGAGRPLGILAGPNLVSITKETGQTAVTVVFNNLAKMEARNNGDNLVFLHNRNTRPQLYALQLPVGTGGTALFIAPGGVSEPTSRALLGYPLVEMKHCPSVGTVGDLILADLSKYIWIEKGGLQADVSMHVRFIQHEQTFRFIFRANGQPIGATAITPAKGGSGHALSPFTAIATRS